jgi:hypothetical protein
MRTFYRALTNFTLTTALAAPLLIGGCAAHSSYRSYDPYYNDYHA